MSVDTTDSSSSNTAAVPRHIAIIMDGNNRWARSRCMPSLAGHKAGADSVRSVIEGCLEQGVEVLTLFAFSSENWKRPAQEVSGLMELFLLSLQREAKKLHRNGIRLRIIGERSRFPEKLQRKMAEVEQLTAGNQRLQLNIAANYGGRWDIVQAARGLAQAVSRGELDIESINEQQFDAYTSLAGIPEPDLCIRTGGEQRISNFLVWQMVYTELYFSELYWPDFNKIHLGAAIRDYGRRQRRFGRTSEQVEAQQGV